MRELKYTAQFKKDVKRIQNNPKKMHLLNETLKILKATGTLPKEYKPHELKGNYQGHIECHIEGDFLLIWIDEINNVIKLVRVGSHSELFE